MTSHVRSVFVDPSGRRWQRVRRLALAAGVVTTVIAIVLIGSVFLSDQLPAYELAGPKRLRPPPPLAGTPAERDRRAARARLYGALERHPAVPALRPARLPLHPGPRGRRTPPAAAPTPPPAGMPAADRITAGFYVNWDDNSYASFSAHREELDWVICEWAFVAPGGDSLRFTVDSAGGRKLLFTVQQMPEPTRPRVFLMVSNFMSSATAARPGFTAAALRRLLTVPAARDRAVAQLAAVVQRHNLAGVTIDFEEIPDDLHPRLLAFLRALRQQLAASGRLLTQAVPTGTDDETLDALGTVNDRIILMAYDEHYRTGDAGPVASQAWYEAQARRAVSRLGPQKVILALGAYGYDWNDAVPSTGTTEMTFQDVMAAARDNGAPVRFDTLSRNPYLTWTDEDSTDHVAWFLDAVTAYNQVRTGATLGTAGQAIWRLGSEDPSLWNVLGRRGIDAPPTSLETIPGGYDVDFEGKGEILRITSRPTMGRRTLALDPRSGAITGERILGYPSPWVVRRTGPPATSHAVALTFDDGPDGTWTGPILDTLRSRGAPATFFIIGRNAETHPGLLQRILRDGHELGNHTFTHPNLALVAPWLGRLQMEANERLVEAFTGRRMRFFRPPYFGDAEPTTDADLRPIAAASQLGYAVAGLHDDSEDWQQPRIDAAGIVDTVLAQRRQSSAERPANVVLLHDGGGDRRETLAALGPLIDSLRARGDTLVLLSAIAGISHQQAMPPLPAGGTVARAIAWAGFRLYGLLEWALYWIFFVAVILGTARLTVVLATAAAERVRRRRRAHAAAAPPCRPPFAPAVSVVVPAYSEDRVIVTTISSLLGQDYAGDLEIVVVDDGSPDDTYQVASQAFGAHARVAVYTKPNGGKASALNYGIERARGEIVIGLDADTIFAPDTVTRLVQPLADPCVGAVAGNAKVGNRINIVTRWQALEYVTSQNLDRRALALLHCITVVPGAVGAWRKSAVLAAGGFSSDTLAEDQDLTIRLLRDGHRVEYADDAVAYTEAPDTLRALAKQRFRWSYGTLQCMWKHRLALLRWNSGPARSGALGLVAMPNTWLFQLLFPAISPVADLMFLLSLISVWLTRLEHGGTYALTSLEQVLVYYAVFLLVDWLAALVAFLLEPGEERSLTWLIFIQRFAYRQVMYWVVVRSFTAAVRGHAVGWGKLERRATVELPA